MDYDCGLTLDIHFHNLEDYHNKDVRSAVERIEGILFQFQFGSCKKIKMEILDSFEFIKRKISVDYDVQTDIWEFHLTGLDGHIKSFTIQKKTRNLEIECI